MYFSKFLPMALIFIGVISGRPAHGQFGDMAQPKDGSFFGPSYEEIMADYETRQEEIREWQEEDERRAQLKAQGEQLKRTQAKQRELEEKLKNLEQQKQPQQAQPQQAPQPQAQQQASKKVDAFEPVYAAYKLENGEKSANEDSVLGPCEYMQDEAIGNGFSVPSGCDKSRFQVGSVTCKSLAGKVTFVSTCKVDGAELSANRCADQHMAPLVKKAIDKQMDPTKKNKGAS